MVVLASSIVDKSGKALLSRQFIEMTKSRIEGLLSSFPKLISAGNQHTFVDTDSVRYIYQPLEEFYMVLITNKTSNILQDIQTLHLFARTVSEYCRVLKEVEIVSKAYEILIAFDEIISLGYRENVTIPQIKLNTEMESHEEKLQEMLQKSKEREAIEAAKLKAKQLEVQRRELSKKGGSTTGSSFSNNSRPFPMPSSSGTYSGTSTSSAASGTPFSNSLAAPVAASQAPRKGMQLGVKAKASDLLDAIKSDEGIPLDNSLVTPVLSPVSSTGPTSLVQKIIPGGVHLSLEEKIVVSLTRDGGLDNLEVKGEVVLRISEMEKAKSRISFFPVENPAIQFKTHPHVDKNLWTSNFIIATKDNGSKPFPVSQPVPVLKWRLVSREETSAPLTGIFFNCFALKLVVNVWPSPSGNGTIDCTVEYELNNKNLELQGTIVSIPISGGNVPKVDHVDGEFAVNNSQKTLDWSIPIIDSSNPAGTMEFSIQAQDVNSMFPVRVSFTSSTPFCDVDISGVENVDSGAPVPFTKEFQLVTEDYRIV